MARYAKKRDFGRTPEPSGRKSARKTTRLRFVIQMHHATRLHYDFRLEADGVLKSWAIPKGPTLALRERRLAMHVEDHPLDYRDFEGIIPKGNYGAGEVIVWDRGWYELAEGDDPAAEIGHGKIKFVLHGKKMNGEFTLVRIHSREESGDPWLLIKDKDEFVDQKYDIERDDKSVKSGKTLAQIAKDPRAPHWISNREERPGSSSTGKKKPVRRDKLPSIKQPMLATLVDEPFDDPEWLFEIKWDGYRAIATIHDDGRLEVVSRNGLDFLGRLPDLRALANAFTSIPIVVDGEIVSLDADGRSSFQRLQNSLESRKRVAPRSEGALAFAVFDCLYADGRDLTKTPLEERKAILRSAIGDDKIVLYSKHVVERGCALFKQAQERRLEGIIGKKRDSLYQQRRSRDWVKIKAQLVQECVIGGFTEPRGSRKDLGALLLGLYDGNRLHYVGHVGTGFDRKLLTALHAKLDPLETTKSPFVESVKSNAPAHWVKPKLVAQIRFTEWTDEGLMRQPVFLGLRVDKDPKSCTRERPIDTDTIA
ncbi:MAG: non-homologous end-joining DNA ligase [Candidatus Eremiobacteraeota bacterium]|nr:non-homologous end-joining DNA ligase [Candidatus Eremiobacteraeota bacterium]